MVRGLENRAPEAASEELVVAGRSRSTSCVAGLQRSGSTKAGRTSDGNCRRQGKGEELIYNQKLQNREDLVLLAAGGLYVLVKGS